MFSPEITEVVEALRYTDRATRHFSTPEGIRAVICAVDIGLCQLVQVQDHAVRLRDESWGVELGIELTNRGIREAARLARG